MSVTNELAYNLARESSTYKVRRYFVDYAYPGDKYDNACCTDDLFDEWFSGEG